MLLHIRHGSSRNIVGMVYREALVRMSKKTATSSFGGEHPPLASQFTYSSVVPIYVDYFGDFPQNL